MTPDDAVYYRERARRERDMADSCTDPTIASAHRRMAEEYEKRVAGSEPESFLAQDRPQSA